MKISASTFKNIDYKQFFINHGEKVGAVLIGLLIAVSVARANWKPYDKTPQELKDNTAEAEQKIKSTPWPADQERSLKSGADLNSRVEKVLEPIAAAPYLLSNPMDPPVYPERMRISNPHWLGVRSLMATDGVAILEMDPSVAKLDEGFIKKPKKEKEKKKTAREKRTEREAKKKEAEEKKEKKKQDDESDVPEDFARNNGPGSAATGIRGGMGGPGTLGLGAGASGRGSRGGAAQRRNEKKGRRGDKDQAPEWAHTPGSMEKAKQAKRNGRGYRFVAVRGVFPLHDQVEELSHAMGDLPAREHQRLLSLIRFKDFRLERQTAHPGPDPWDERISPWELVDQQPVINLLRNEIAGWAAETVSNAVIDNHICMPLPERMVGQWGSLATHPGIQNFVLSDEEVETQVKAERLLVQRMREEEQKTKKETKGWGSFTENFRTATQRATELKSKSLIDQIEDEAKANGDSGKVDKELRDYFKKLSSAANHLLLFRYLDFTVKPGQSYRYRVQLIVANPFQDRQIEEVSDPSVVEGPERPTEWSAASNPVTVQRPATYFVKNVEGRATSALPGVELDLYQWFVSTGTVVNRKVRAQLGQLVGGKATAPVLRPEISFDDEKVPFSTSDALLDVVKGFSLDSRTSFPEIVEAPELKSVADKRGLFFAVPDEALLVDDNGNLVTLDTLEQQAQYKQTKQRYTWQNKPWESLREGEDEEDAGASVRASIRSGGRQPKKSDPRRKGGRSGGGSSSSY